MTACSKCQTHYDQEDAFCRKCGATLAQEAHYTEIASSPDDAATLEPTVVIEVTSLATNEPNRSLATPDKGRLRSLTTKVGSSVGRALQSESGKRAVKGATALVVAVGVELLTQAAARPRQTPAQGKKLSPPVHLADSLLRTIEEEFGPVPQDAVIEEVYVRERTYMRRIVRRPRL